MQMPVGIAEIQAAVLDHFGLPPIEMVSARRAGARPRQIAMALSHELTPNSYPVIGRHFGNRDHTTVMHAVKTVKKLCDEDAAFARDVADIRASLLARSAA